MTLQSQAGNGASERMVLDDSNFPSMGNAEAPTFGPGFGAFASRGAPRPEDFPALPGLSLEKVSRTHNLYGTPWISVVMAVAVIP